MKSYGKVDETWDDARFQTLIEDALGMAKEGKKRHAIGQNRNGNVVVTGDGPDNAYRYVCWTTRKSKKAPEDDLVLSDHCEYSKYSVEQMVPRVRNALARGIIDFGCIRFLSEGRMHLDSVCMHAKMIVRMHDKPFIVGQIDEKIRAAPLSERDRSAGITPDMSKHIVVAPLSERNYFIDFASCIMTSHGCWSLLDRIPDSDVYKQWDRVRILDSKTVRVSDRRLIYLGWMPSTFIYSAILDPGKNSWRTRLKK